jgi:hypothetical protein
MVKRIVLGGSKNGRKIIVRFKLIYQLSRAGTILAKFLD